MAKNKEYDFKIPALALRSGDVKGYLTAIWVDAVYVPSKIIRNRKTGGLIVLWKDGEKTEVKPMPGTEDSVYTAFTAALAKRVYGSNSAVNRLVATVIEPVKHVKKKPYQFNDETVEELEDKDDGIVN